MAKVYRKTKKYAKKRKVMRTYSASKSMRNPREFSDYGRKTFAGLPRSLGVKTSFHADPRLDPVSAIGGQTAGTVYQAYTYFDLLDMSKPLKPGFPSVCFPHATHHLAMGRIYQEFRYESTAIHVDLTLDVFDNQLLGGINHFPMQSVQLVCAIVPLSYMKTAGGIGHNIANTGVWNTGVDYYSALTSVPGSKTYVLAQNGNNKVQSFYAKTDAFAHSGSPVVGRFSMINSQLILLGNGDPIVTVTYPGAALGVEQNVLVMACRWKPTSNLDRFEVRASMRWDQNLTYRDLVPPIQYLVYPNGAEPDNL